MEAEGERNPGPVDRALDEPAGVEMGTAWLEACASGETPGNRAPYPSGGAL